MRSFFGSKPFKILIILLVTIIISSSLALVLPSKSSPISSVVGIIYAPIQKATSYLSSLFDNLKISFRSSNQYLERIKDLENQISVYEKELADFEGIKTELNDLKSVLDLKEKNKDFQLAYSSIIGKDSIDIFNSFIIDKGSADGIEVNDPVIYGDYVVGVVNSVKTTYSVVWTVLNPKVNISAVESKTRESGYITSDVETAADNVCKLNGLPRNSKVKKGAIVTTSGLGGIFPKGLIVGKIFKIDESNIDNTNIASIKLGVDISELENVFVITDFEAQKITDFESLNESN